MLKVIPVPVAHVSLANDNVKIAKYVFYVNVL